MKTNAKPLKSVFTKALILLIIIFGAALLLPFTAAAKTSLHVPVGIKPARAAALQYGLIGEDATLLDQDLAPLTGLPSSYFVIIITETPTHYNVQYSDLSGFVDKSKITPIDYEPKLKFGAAYFIANNDTHPVNVRSRPQSGAEIVGTIPDGESAFYYGAAGGDALIPAAGDLWYYVRLNGGTRGYVYSAQGAAGVLPLNSGERTETPAPTDGGETSGGGGATFPDWGFILLLAVPAVIITLALFAKKPKGGKDTPRP